MILMKLLFKMIFMSEIKMLMARLKILPCYFQRYRRCSLVYAFCVLCMPHKYSCIVVIKLLDLHSAKECNIVKASLILFNAPNAALSTSFVGLVFVLLEFNIRIIATSLTYLVP